MPRAEARIPARRQKILRELNVFLHARRLRLNFFAEKEKICSILQNSVLFYKTVLFAAGGKRDEEKRKKLNAVQLFRKCVLRRAPFAF
jgi:hypothetical protein